MEHKLDHLRRESDIALRSLLSFAESEGLPKN